MEFFLVFKNYDFIAFKKLTKILQNEKGCNICSIRNDQGGEFQNDPFDSFCEIHGIRHDLFALRTLQ